MRYSKHGNIIDDTRYIPDLRRRYPADPSDPTYIDILKISRAELGELKRLLAECEKLFPYQPQPDHLIRIGGPGAKDLG
jgi:hypothetical protein